MDEPTIDASAVRARLGAVRARIAAAGADPAAVTIVAVTKGFGADAVEAALAAGLRDVGESYAQELRRKVAALDLAMHGARWHFIGRVQRNKVRLVAADVALWQSVDRLSVATEIAHRAPGASVLVQVAVRDDPGRGGCLPGLVPAVVDGSRDLGLAVEGLMAVAPLGPAEAAAAAFAQVRSLADRLQLPVRSMGMTHDLEAAVAAGTTMVRVGSALFGERPPRPR